MVVSETEIKYAAYLKKTDNRWDYANSILYRMCKENPEHKDEHVIVGKLWLIGRSYAAAIERRKNASVSNDDFYYEVVAPRMLSVGDELDSRISELLQSQKPIKEEIEKILCTHKFLVDSFNRITGLQKRSLASKYLHFHCPEKFFIYDSRARTAIGKYVKRPNKKILLSFTDYDAEYADFVCRMLELQESLSKKTGIFESPRKLDSFLLEGVD